MRTSCQSLPPDTTSPDRRSPLKRTSGNHPDASVGILASGRRRRAAVPGKSGRTNREVAQLLFSVFISKHNERELKSAAFPAVWGGGSKDEAIPAMPAKYKFVTETECF
jgi:hypothetical protein